MKKLNNIYIYLYDTYFILLNFYFSFFQNNNDNNNNNNNKLRSCNNFKFIN